MSVLTNHFLRRYALLPHQFHRRSIVGPDLERPNRKCAVISRSGDGKVKISVPELTTSFDFAEKATAGQNGFPEFGNDARVGLSTGQCFLISPTRAQCGHVSQKSGNAGSAEK